MNLNSDLQHPKPVKEKHNIRPGPTNSHEAAQPRWTSNKTGEGLAGEALLMAFMGLWAIGRNNLLVKAQWNPVATPCDNHMKGRVLPRGLFVGDLPGQPECRGMSHAAAKAAQVVSPLLPGLLLEKTGYLSRRNKAIYILKCSFTLGSWDCSLGIKDNFIIAF